MSNDLDNFQNLIREKGVSVSTEEFHHAVNTIFHDVESKTYDAIHKGMDESLQQQYDLLSQDILSDAGAGLGNNLTLLDIGCGTGMSTEKLLQSPIGKKIGKIHLLDSSKGMLDQCKKKADTWGIPYTQTQGYLNVLNGVQFDIVLACSLLHHVPNLNEFLLKVASLQPTGGYFMHLMDPNGDCIFSDEYLKRRAELKAEMKRQAVRKDFLKVAGGKLKSIMGIKSNSPSDEEEYIQEVNQRLMNEKIIKVPLTSTEIWSITDLHVEGQPGNFGQGISFNQMKSTLGMYQVVSRRSYGFYGRLKSEMPQAFAEKEEQMIREKRIDGRQLEVVWRKL